MRSSLKLILGVLALVALAVSSVADEVDDLIEDLKYGTLDVRDHAAWSLGEIGSRGDARAVDPLIEALQDEDPYVRMDAARSLGLIGDPRAVDPLIEALQDENESVRRYAADAIGLIGDPRAVEPLIEALKDEIFYVRCAAAGSLGKIGDTRAVEPLIEALKDEDENVRRSAAEALGEIGDARAVDPLIEALNDEVWWVRSWVAGALGEIGDARAVDPLGEALKDEDSAVRWQAAEALGEIGDARAVDPLIEALNDENWAVRGLAASALGEIGDARAIDPLVEALNDENELTRSAASEALKKIEVHGVTEVPEIIEETETPEETRGVPEVRIATAFDYPVGTPRAQGGSGYVTQTKDGNGWYNAQDWADYNSDYGGYHPGEDWNSEQGGSSDVGAPVYAIADGIVSAITTKVAGNGIALKHTLPSGESIYSVYIHIDIQSDLNIGSEVRVGDRIGSIANIASSGMSPHLHFEIRTSPVIPQDWYPNDNGIGYYPSMERLRSDGFTVDPSDFIDGHRGGGETEAVGRIEIHAVAEAPEITEEAEAPKESPLPVSIGAISIISAVLFIRSRRGRSWLE